MKQLVTILGAVALATTSIAAQQGPAPSQPPAVTQPVMPAPSQTPPPAQGVGRGQGQGQGRGTTAPAPTPTPPPVQGRGFVPVTTPPPGQNPPRAEPPSSWQNVKVDVVVVDSGTPEPQNRKSVSMLVLDSRAGSIRSQGHVSAVINVDATPTVRPDGRVYLRVTFEYRVEPVGPPTNQNAPSINISESLYLVLPDGKPVIVSQAADPRSDRKVTVEITATVQK